MVANIPIPDIQSDVRFFLSRLSYHIRHWS